MPIHADTIPRGIAALPGVVSRINKVGTPVTSVTGTPGRLGNWNLYILNAENSTLRAQVIDIGGTRERTVVANGSYTDLIPGITIVLGGSLNHGDMASILYEREFIVNT
jgi:hypothetical protein